MQSSPGFGMSQPSFEFEFGSSSAASPFGASTPAFGGGSVFSGSSFGLSIPAFGAQSAAAPFGQFSPAFGGGAAFGAPFGASSSPGFGQPSAFGGMLQHHRSLNKMFASWKKGYQVLPPPGWSSEECLDPSLILSDPCFIAPPPPQFCTQMEMLSTINCRSLVDCIQSL